MMMSSSARSKFPFTASQWQELEHQALIFKYMVSGMPIPPHLLYTIRRSLDSSTLSSSLLLHQPQPQPQHQHIGWNCFQMDFGRKIDPEPGRCRRTDGKKWRCSKEAYPDSKYCERHMHRGRNRSRKPVETVMTTSTTRPTTPTATPISSSSITKDSSSNHSKIPFAYPPHSSSSRPPSGGGGGLAFSSSQDNTTNFLLESSAYSHTPTAKNNRNSYGHGMKDEVGEHSFLCGSSVDDDSWNLTMGGSLIGHSNQKSCSGQSYLQLQSQQQQQRQDDHHQQHHYYDELRSIDDHQHRPKKVMHHFFDEWPLKDKDSWLDSDQDKLSINDVSLSKTHLSISMPNSAHDFFISQTDK